MPMVIKLPRTRTGPKKCVVKKLLLKKIKICPDLSKKPNNKNKNNKLNSEKNLSQEKKIFLGRKKTIMVTGIVKSIYIYIT